MIANKVIENAPFKMDYRLKKEIKPIFQSQDFEIFKRYQKIFNITVQNKNNNKENQNNKTNKLPAIK